tara:strand:+ start:38157 stop:40646 length:2490 start_codon:yes stop_codon:yes gene_type:complete
MAGKNDGKGNPCGAYYPGSGVVSLPNANSKCAGNTQNGHKGFNLNNDGASRGFCCDMMSRIDDTAQWKYSYNYVPFVTAFAIGGNCKGCPNQVWRPHVSKKNSGTGNNRQPCKYLLGAGWKKSWHQCYFGLNNAFGCTNPNSFGIITNNTAPGSRGYIGSPNGTCQSNCMQLTQSYFEDWAVSGINTSLADYPPCNFSREAYFDCEPPEYDSNGSPGASGSKLIWTRSGSRDPNNQSKSTPIYIDGVEYKLSGQNGFRGYLHPQMSVGNAWGQKGGPTNTTPHLWHRKSGFDITAAGGPTSSFMDFDGCCTFVSFGCKDPNFGSYSSQALLNCDGKSQTNQADSSGNCSGGAGTCYGSGFNCSACISTVTNTYDPALITPGTYDPEDSDTCYQETWDACGGSGELSQGAWSQMISNRPKSDLYDYGRFWDKAGNDVTDGGDKPLCQCNNQGCTLPGASNYSPLNTLDCEGNAINPNGTNDVSCCTFQEFGCTDTTFNSGNQNNYFCTIDTGPGNAPDNSNFCMDPATGQPCADPSLNVWNCGPGSGVSPLGGIPLNPNLPNGGFVPTNPVVSVTDDGNCEQITVPGCRDDGGVLNGGTWPSPQYPGFSSLNFNQDATIHVQSECIYGFGCVDVLAENVLPNTSGIDTSVCGGISLQDKANEVNLSNPTLPQPVTASFVLDNLIPDITCCDYSIPGEGPGCTDPNALNYNPLANIDDGSCIYNIEGCTDPNAINFNPNATLDDGSCLYSLDFPEEGTNFLDGSLVELCREPLVKEEVLMNVCQPTEIQSEVFIERGKQSVFETNQRLGEVTTIGGLIIYGYGFYNIKEQI